MIRAGVIGHPIAHSRSPLIHGHWLEKFNIDGSYERFDVAPQDLPRFIGAMRENGLSGCNCTLPHKEAVLALAGKASDAAKAIGAANTLWFENGVLHADNTDAPGYLANLDEEAPGWDQRLQEVMVLGAGGAARAILHALLSRGAGRIHLVNRSPERAEALAAAFGPRIQPVSWDAHEKLLGSLDLLVNSTSLGMRGQPGLTIDSTRLPSHATVSDIVYIPLETELIASARAAGLKTSGGLGMLLHQAAPGFAHWFGTMPEVTAELRALIEASLPKE
jgi:shikimate dehydrogenase